MTARETENNAFAKLGVTNKEHYGMLRYFLERSIVSFRKEESDFCLFIFLAVFLALIIFCFFPHPHPHHSSNGPSLNVHWKFPDIKKMLKFFVHTINYKG